MRKLLDMYFFLSITLEKDKEIILKKEEYDRLKPFIKRNVCCAFRQKALQDFLLHSIDICVEDGLPIKGCAYEMVRRAKEDILRFEVRILTRATEKEYKNKGNNKNTWL